MRKSHLPRPAHVRRFGLAFAISALFASSAYAAGDPNLPASAAVRQALQRDLGLTATEIPRYFETERLAIRRQSEAQRALGPTYAGSWLERDASGAFSFVVATTQQAQAAKARALGAQARIVRHSLSALEASMSKLNAVQKTDHVGVLRATESDIYSWNIDLSRNSVLITHAPGAEKIAAAMVARSGANPATVRYTTSTARPQPNVDVLGGDRYTLTNGVGCSVGLSVFNGWASGFATAGHCGTAGTQTITGSPGYWFGPFHESHFPGADQAWVRNDWSEYWSNPPLVNLYNGHSMGVVGNLQSPIGGVICRSGMTTGWRCGLVTAHDASIKYSAGIVYGLTFSTACAGLGDSGGSVISPWGEAQGVHSGAFIPNGSFENCGTIGLPSMYQPIQPLLNSYGLQLITLQTCGRMNAGRVLDNGGSVTSCDGRFTFVIQGDGHLVLYQAGVGAIWGNHVFGSGHTLHMLADGRLQVQNGVGEAVWHTGTYDHHGAFLTVQNDGNVVLYSHTGQGLWSTGTSGR
jgi:Alpha-lytic protease prodomain